MTLKVGQVVMILRNINICNCLCNGTRIFISQLSVRLIKGKLISGPGAGETVYLPRIKLLHNGKTHAPIPFSQFQFQITTAFCMTINKSQGQPLVKVGVLLPAPVFSHGQLYVALSRCSKLENLMVAVCSETDDDCTLNTECRKALLDEASPQML